MNGLSPWALLGLGWALMMVFMAAPWLVRLRTSNAFSPGHPRPDPQESGQ